MLNEGLARWQLVTGTTVLEGVSKHFGNHALYGFLIYLLIWTFFVAAALMSASGVALQAMLPLFSDSTDGKIVYGILCSIAGLLMVRIGGYQLFEKVMNICIGLMFVTVLLTAVILIPDWLKLFKGFIKPSIPNIYDGGLAWTVALIGGVGGTVTILCYGYWIREEGREGKEEIKASRIDIGIAYVITALFGMAMVIIGSTVEVEGGGATLILNLADRLIEPLGQTGKWIFLLGAFGAIFSSLLGVWQSVPYLFADLWLQFSKKEGEGNQRVDTNSKLYRYYLYGMATIPIVGLWFGFARMQQFYAIIGAIFIPILAMVLLVLNGRAKYIGTRYKNNVITFAFLTIILVFFLWILFTTIHHNLS